jgi:hypothetical protein
MELHQYPISDSDYDIAAEADALVRRLSNFDLQPFTMDDVSVGMEYELQVAVKGDHKDVDLPQAIFESRFFKNIAKRAGRGDLPPKSIEDLRGFLYHNETRVWENSWVRLRENRLGEAAKKLLSHDLLADKNKPDGPKRSDIDRFYLTLQGETWLRLPASYLLRLALADAIGATSPIAILKTARDILPHFLSDNTSPEILSFTIPTGENIGNAAGRETARTFLLTQILVQYANTKLGLGESGQKCLLYNAPHAPYRQKMLNEMVPDGFYRHLFMSPCLAGWDKGEDKHRYMDLCHRTLSRSQLNTISKLKDAGIITNNLVVLPNTSNTCLANNGTHVSLGSRLLSSFAESQHSGFTPRVEKYIGDLVIKIVEHFLPLFVTTYTAAPYRLDFADFHPEKVLGFLPHELDYTHLRMIWRRWKKKAGLRFLGRSVTPFGPRTLDNIIAKVLHLQGDLVPDFRLIDYLTTLLSTESCPGLNGMPGNHIRLKQELSELGIFDQRMSIYLPYRQREFQTMGYSGFEGRSYSLFPSLQDDIAGAVNLQTLVTALAYRAIITGRVRHADIPDRPAVESERRQIFFAAAIGLPTFFVKADTGNRFLRKILGHVKNQRNSKRYKGYIRVPINEYRMALLEMIAGDGKHLIRDMGLTETIRDLRSRLDEGGTTALDKLINGALPGRGKKKPLSLPAATFNAATEHYYRTELKRLHTEEGLTVLAADCERLERLDDPHLRQVMTGCNRSAVAFLRDTAESLLAEKASPEDLQHLLRIGLAVIHHERLKNR